MTAKPYRILMLLENETYPDDVRVYLEASALVEAGFDVTIVCPCGEHARGYAMVEGVRVYRYPNPWEGSGLLAYIAEFGYSIVVGFVYAMYVMLRHGFDAIHVHMPPDMNSVVGVAYRLLGKKYVLDMHDLSPELYQALRDNQGSKLIWRTLQWFERFACRQANRLIATNKTQQRRQIDHGVNPADSYIVRNGPNEMFLGDVKPHPEIVDLKPFVIGYVGMVGPQDRVDYFVSMIDKLRGVRDDFVGVIVGDGKALESVKDQVKSLGLEDYVRCTGNVKFSDVPSHIAAFDVCVTPDPSNPYNDSCTMIKTMEYMALRKPIVAFAATIENRLTAGDAAVYAEEDNPEELAKLVNQLLDDPEQRDQMGEVGRSRVDKSLSWDHQKKQLIALYDGLSLGRAYQISESGSEESKSCEVTAHASS